MFRSQVFEDSAQFLWVVLQETDSCVERECGSGRVRQEVNVGPELFACDTSETIEEQLVRRTPLEQTVKTQ